MMLFRKRPMVGFWEHVLKPKTLSNRRTNQFPTSCEIMGRWTRVWVEGSNGGWKVQSSRWWKHDVEDNHFVDGGIVCWKGFGNFEEGGVCYGTASVIEASSTMQSLFPFGINLIGRRFGKSLIFLTTWRFNWVDHGGIVQPNTPALSKKEHVNHHHIPFRKDCVVCQATQQRQLPHRRGLHPRCGVLSLGTTGPFHEAADLQGKGKYVSVGEMTWMAPSLTTKWWWSRSIFNTTRGAGASWMQCKMRLEQRISLRRNINQENRHQRMVLELEMQAARDSGLGEPNHLRKILTSESSEWLCRWV